MTWQATVLTIFPEMFPGPLGISLSGKALEKGIWKLKTLDIRDFTSDKHQSVDDAPFGGGAGMVMRSDVVDAAVEASGDVGPLIYLSPRGIPLTQSKAKSLAEGPGVRLLSGRYEGIDQRVLDTRKAEEISVGDYVLSGGELGAMVLIDACIRLLPGFMGQSESLIEESFEGGLLEYPHYTRPRVWNGIEVPAVLTSGDHSRIAAWRREQAKATTRERRPDMWAEFARRG
ncbi:MAG: tRNA (guanosine(37)-N1)-methyltransferase TrmD [Rhodospirillales bacterium]|jgi:tRNA (guanine37-N1)-methyltransferase